MSHHSVLGLDASTQSITAVLVDRETGNTLAEHSVAYPRAVWLEAEHPGQADQSPAVFVATFERLLTELKAKHAPLETVERIGVSAQQHGCVFLSEDAAAQMATLRQAPGPAYLTRLSETLFSHPRAPIWMTSDTAPYADALRKAAGGKAAMIALTGSDSPLRFTGAMIRRFGEEHPRRYEHTARVALLSQFFPMLLTGSLDVAVDWGDGSGTSLMDYRARTWSPAMLEACAHGLPGGTAALQTKLGPVADPLTVAGKIAPWFVQRFGFSPSCEVLIGSGDNPQTKVLAEGDLLSLGSSFVLMASEAFDPRGWGNAMYDGLGRPFVFGCRTNGALVWDELRKTHNADFSRAEAALSAHPAGSVVALSQPLNESFPPSPVVTSTITGESFERQWAAAVDSALGLLFLGAKPWFGKPGSSTKAGVLLLTGGPASSSGLVRRIAAFANRPVQVIGTTGAALGAAAAAHALGGKAPDWLRTASASTLPPVVQPLSADVDALHRAGGYLDQLKQLFETKTGIDPTGERV